VIFVSALDAERLGDCLAFRALRRIWAALRLRAFVGLLLALERRRIAHPRLRTTPILTDYIRDLRPAKWGSMINLRSLSALSLGWLFSSSGRALVSLREPSLLARY
jgi:hypothetical protein